MFCGLEVGQLIRERDDGFPRLFTAIGSYDAWSGHNMRCLYCRKLGVMLDGERLRSRELRAAGLFRPVCLRTKQASSAGVE